MRTRRELNPGRGVRSPSGYPLPYGPIVFQCSILPSFPLFNKLVCLSLFLGNTTVENGNTHNHNMMRNPFVSCGDHIKISKTGLF